MSVPGGYWSTSKLLNAGKLEFLNGCTWYTYFCWIMKQIKVNKSCEVSSLHILFAVAWRGKWGSTLSFSRWEPWSSEVQWLDGSRPALRMWQKPEGLWLPVPYFGYCAVLFSSLQLPCVWHTRHRLRLAFGGTDAFLEPLNEICMSNCTFLEDKESKIIGRHGVWRKTVGGDRHEVNKEKSKTSAGWAHSKARWHEERGRQEHCHSGTSMFCGKSGLPALLMHWGHPQGHDLPAALDFWTKALVCFQTPPPEARREQLGSDSKSGLILLLSIWWRMRGDVKAEGGRRMKKQKGEG